MRNPSLLTTSSLACFLAALLLLLLAAAIQADASTAAAATSAASVRTSSSLGGLISELEGEGCEEVATACLVASRSATRKTLRDVASEIVGGGGGDSASGSATIGSPSSGVALAVDGGGGLAGGASAVVYYADPVDVGRGEGLFERLAPVAEAATKSKSSLLVVVCGGTGGGDGNVDATRSALEREAQSYLSKLAGVGGASSSTLQEAFGEVLYVATPAQAAQELAKRKVPAAEAAERCSKSAASASLSSMSSSSAPADLAAARTLGPVARSLLVRTVEQVRNACSGGGGGGGGMSLVPDFGALCDAAVDRAVEALDDAAATASPAVRASGSGKRIRADLVQGLDGELCELFRDQLELCREAAFEECRKLMSKLLVSPNLGSDMRAVASKSAAAFGKSASRLVSRKYFASSWSSLASTAQAEYRTFLNDLCTNRLQSAEAGGQYRPLPRKGVTVGLHWLLPKPFGNDYRQEPWMVHASDNMVYVPRDKITDVSPDEVASGDWRNKIVPSPVGNDMLYMQ